MDTVTKTRARLRFQSRFDAQNRDPARRPEIGRPRPHSRLPPSGGFLGAFFALLAFLAGDGFEDRA
jgi:hypothetical protein